MHDPVVMPALVAGIHDREGTRGIAKTWMAGTKPGHDENSDGAADRTTIIRARLWRQNFATFRRQTASASLLGRHQDLAPLLAQLIAGHEVDPAI